MYGWFSDHLDFVKSARLQSISSYKNSVKKERTEVNTRMVWMLRYIYIISTIFKYVAHQSFSVRWSASSYDIQL